MISTMEIMSGVSSFLYSKYQSLFYMILIFLISKVLGFNAVIIILIFYWCSLVQLEHFVCYAREVYQGYILQIYCAERFSVIGCLICRNDGCRSLTSFNFKQKLWNGLEIP